MIRIVMLTKLGVATLFAAAALSAGAQDVRFGERVEVERVLVDARVIDAQGKAVLGLQAEDFRLEIDGRIVKVESALWGTGAAEEAALVPAQAVAEGAPVDAAGRLIVFFFQKSFEGSRLSGLIRMQQRARQFLGTLRPNDRVAVLSYDSHLILWLDFTTDRERLVQVIAGFHRWRERYVPAGDEPSLAEHFDRSQARRAGSPETALLVTGRALEPLPGPKSLVLFGWGLGRFGLMGVTLEADYGPARRVLQAARTAVFALDVTDADYHSLEVGLEQVAEDTGGFYAKTHLFPGLVMEKLQHTLEGHYILSFEKPLLPRGSHEISIELVRHKGTVLAKRSYEG